MSTRLDVTSWRSRFKGLLPAMLIGFLVLLAWKNSFVQDDAFISFRYAKNLVRGFGLVWNPGERIEGYTNFLWVLLMAIPLRLGKDPVFFSKLLGLAFALGTFVLAYRLYLRLLPSRSAALLAVALLGTNYSFSAYATGGLETQMQTFLFVASFAGVFALTRPGRAAYWGTGLLSVTLALAILTRLDSALCVGVVLVYFGVLLRGERPRRQRVLSLVMILLPLIAIVGAWLWWKRAYYGGIIPNTFYAKVSGHSVRGLKIGAWYVYAFVFSYLLTPILLIAVVRIRKILSQVESRLLAAFIALWLLYIVAVGGDFMEFRMLVPILPFVFLLLVQTLYTFSEARVRAAFVGLVLIGSLNHRYTFQSKILYETEGVIASIWSSQDPVDPNGRDWVSIGKRLGTIFGGETSDVTIAVAPAGAIPFYSGLRTVDMYGLNDSWVARHGIEVSRRPGHQRLAPHRYLESRGVNLVVAHPIVKPREAVQEEYSWNDLLEWLPDFAPELLSEDACIVEIPLDSGDSLIVLCLHRNATIDRAIHREHLATRPIVRLVGTGSPRTDTGSAP